MDARFSYSAVASPLHDEAAVGRLLEGVERALAEAGGERTTVEDAPAELPLVHVVLTGGTERSVLARLETRRARAEREPVILVAHPGHNSLPASLEILARVRSDGGSGQIVFLDGPGAAEELGAMVHLAEVALGLRRARLGALGEPSEWLVASSHAPAAVREGWGPTMVRIPLSEWTERLAARAPDAALAREVIGAARECEVPEAEVSRAGAASGALQALVAEHALAAVTVRCFDLVTEQRTTGCLALSQLGDAGIPAACEGDVPSALALLWLHRLTGVMPWMANPSRVAPERGELVLAHCTVPRSLVGAYDVRTHFESGLGVALGGELPRGPVTLVRLGGARLEQAWIVEGELLEPLRDETLCRTQARIRADSAAVAELLERPLGNHVVLLPGRHAALARASRRFILGGAAS